MEDTGHLFVVHGRIEDVIHDAAILPVDNQVRWHRYWRPLIGPNPEPPGDWHRGFGRVMGGPGRVWAVDVTPEDRDYDTVLNRIHGALERVERRRDAHDPARGGARPLVAVPVVGIGEGGFAQNRGYVIRRLTELLHRSAIALDIDVVLVTPDPSVYAAAQYARPAVRLPDHLEATSEQLATQSQRGELALLLGAGVSAAAGLPAWSALLDALASSAGLGPEDPDRPLSITDRAELIQRTIPDTFRDEIVREASRDVRPSLLHGLLAGLDVREVITTNYDGLYERAVRACGRDIESVLPWKSARGAERWVLKLHGDVRYPETIVLTRRHMVAFDSTNRPSGALLQSLLLTRRLLVVGTSMTDDNVLRLAHEVEDYCDHYKNPSQPFGTVLDSGGDKPRRRLWEGRLDWVDLTDAGFSSGHRVVELFLDRVAQHAARDSSWLLDERFADLLNNDLERELAHSVRQLYRKFPPRPGTKWEPLLERLREFGVDENAWSQLRVGGRRL